MNTKKFARILSVVLFLNLALIPTAFGGLETSTITQSTLPTTFTFSGSGFGHGVGLSQIGAKGMALDGKNAVDILNYFFPGTQVQPVVDTQTLKVNIAHQVPKLNIKLASSNPDGRILISNQVLSNFSSETPTLTGISATINNSSYLSATIKNNMILLNSINGNLSTLIGMSNYWRINWIGNGSYIGVTESSTTTLLKYGYLELFAVPIAGATNKVRIEGVTNLSLHDQYLLGVGEVSNGWLPAAVEAQTIASRTYAYRRASVIKPECQCNLYSSKYDQSFVGFAKENMYWGDQFRQDVLATDSSSNQGLVVTYKGKPIDVYFFSSDGGITQNAKDVWGTSEPYLTNVPDKYSLEDNLNPGYAHWRVQYSQSQVATWLGMPNVSRLLVDGKTLAGANLKIIAYEQDGTKKIFTVSQFKTTVLLPSSWFSISSN